MDPDVVEMSTPITSAKELDFFEHIREWSWSVERAGRVHTHLYVVLKTRAANHLNAFFGARKHI